MINWNKGDERVSKYFFVYEVTRGDPRRIPLVGSIQEKRILLLAKELDKVRDLWGSQIGITSWYRPEPVNQMVGGVAGSQHTLGSAADIYNLYGNSREFEDWLDGVWGIKGLGYGVRSGRGFTHLDLRVGRLRWDY